jgi:hypothetical protein
MITPDAGSEPYARKPHRRVPLTHKHPGAKSRECGPRLESLQCNVCNRTREGRLYPNRTQLNELASHLTRLAENEPLGNRIEVLNEQIVVNGAYLHTDGEWATYPERIEVND